MKATFTCTSIISTIFTWRNALKCSYVKQQGDVGFAFFISPLSHCFLQQHNLSGFWAKTTQFVYLSLETSVVFNLIVLMLKKRAVTVIITEQRRGGCHTGRTLNVFVNVSILDSVNSFYESSVPSPISLHIQIQIQIHTFSLLPMPQTYTGIWSAQCENSLNNMSKTKEICFHRVKKRPFDVLYQNVLTGENKHVVCSQRQKKIITV